MSEIEIKKKVIDVPMNVVEVLKAAAKADRRSLKSYIEILLIREAERLSESQEKKA
jgi:hypothetical protein